MSIRLIYDETLGFKCSHVWEDGQKDEWHGSITRLRINPNYIEFQISSRSSLYVICGKGERGYWACIPDYMAGCDLSSCLYDTFYNTEKLSVAMNNMVDAITISQALKQLYSKQLFKV